MEITFNNFFAFNILASTLHKLLLWPGRPLVWQRAVQNSRHCLIRMKLIKLKLANKGEEKKCEAAATPIGGKDNFACFVVVFSSESLTSSRIIKSQREPSTLSDIPIIANYELEASKSPPPTKRDLIAANWAMSSEPTDSRNEIVRLKWNFRNEESERAKNSNASCLSNHNEATNCEMLSRSVVRSSEEVTDRARNDRASIQRAPTRNQWFMVGDFDGELEWFHKFLFYSR